jgi:hypothetical protein
VVGQGYELVVVEAFGRESDALLHQFNLASAFPVAESETGVAD